ncbi:hypothetical protein [Streptomyces bauhiniae]|uniref:hypothetical protein n=1 Tax=Streptomyces bauhiniae TaxID=2340725 RepID=UPI003813D70A
MRESMDPSLAKGDCFDTAGGDLGGAVYDIRTVPCAGAHEGEVFARTPTRWTLGRSPTTSTSSI